MRFFAIPRSSASTIGLGYGDTSGVASYEKHYAHVQVLWAYLNDMLHG